jgi:predicted Zn-dependent protease
MNIKELASKPQLIQVNIDEPTIVEKYGDVITFYTYDVVSLSTYFEFYDARSEGQMNNLEKMIRKLVLSEDGNPAIGEDEDLPIDIATEVVKKIGEVLGKSHRKSLTQNPGEQQK